MCKIDYNSYRSVKGFNRRIRFIVMHYTAADFFSSIKLLAGDGGVSAHYLVQILLKKTTLTLALKICVFSTLLMRAIEHGMQVSVIGKVEVVLTTHQLVLKLLI